LIICVRILIFGWIGEGWGIFDGGCCVKKAVLVVAGEGKCLE